MGLTDRKSLIAYYSRPGGNYAGGRIVNLQVGNTEVVAKKIQAITGGDIFRIDTAKRYPEDYQQTTEVAQEEKQKHARPELTASVEGMSAYDVIYLGYPNWWGTMPMAVYAFLESYDLSGKAIAPFCTHEGSGLGSSERDIKQLCPDATVVAGLPIVGSRVKNADKNIDDWLKRIG